MPVQFEIETHPTPVKVWTSRDRIDAGAISQLANVAKLPFVFKHVAAMPDVHVGMGATVGSVIATKGAVLPAAVGVDIGCGMMAARLDLPKERVLDKLPKLRRRIEALIPVGPDGNRSLSPTARSWKGWGAFDGLTVASGNLKERAQSQLGSLGGGNHFIEVCLDEDGVVWLMLHSGSRNIGKTLAERHIQIAKGVMRRLHESAPDPDLAHFAEGTPEFAAYMHDLGWAQDYAAENREEMMRRVLRAVTEVCADGEPPGITLRVNCHHNYASREHHFNEDVIVTRKGAVSARHGELGIIPGSMGTRSYIVRGRGNADSFCSCSHGAGRRISRGQAKRLFTLGDLAVQTRGVECRRDAGVIDEIPAAYKDIDEVMRDQTDLVEVVAVLKQVLCVKG